MTNITLLRSLGHFRSNSIFSDIKKYLQFEPNMKQVLLANQCYDFALGFSSKRCELLFTEIRLTHEIWGTTATLRVQWLMKMTGSWENLSYVLSIFDCTQI